MLQRIDGAELIATLERTNLLFVLGIALSLLPAMWLRAYRWSLFFPDQKSARQAGLVPALYIGYMVNTIAPLRMGELVRAYLVGQRDRLGVSTSIATIVMEKLFDAGSVTVIFVVLALIATLPDWANAAALTSGVALLIGVIGSICLLMAEQRVIRLIEFIETRIPMLTRLNPRGLAASFLDGFRSMQSPRTLVWTLVWSAVLWLGVAVMLALGLLAVDVPVTPAMVFFLLVVTNLGMAVPSAPGYVGVYHALVIVALGVFGIPETTALSVAIVLHTTVFGIFILGGLVYLWRGQFSLLQLMSRAGAEQVRS
jgi:uncharacterized protein (TIRG00374 family)